jgi:hypothetical protein
MVQCFGLRQIVGCLGISGIQPERFCELVLGIFKLNQLHQGYSQVQVWHGKAWIQANGGLRFGPCVRNLAGLPKQTTQFEVGPPIVRIQFHHLMIMFNCLGPAIMLVTTFQQNQNSMGALNKRGLAKIGVRQLARFWPDW